jgi:hypothetical protein
MFHCLAYSNANLLIGSSGAERSAKAWTQVYRAINHGAAKTACNSNAMKKFPLEIQEFAAQFVTMQELRHSADYDPDTRLTKQGVLKDIEQSEAAIRAFSSSPRKDRKAFSALVLFPRRT